MTAQTIDLTKIGGAWADCSLPELAAEINRLLADSDAALIQMARLLLQAKARFERGETDAESWDQWVADNIHLSRSWVYKLLKVARSDDPPQALEDLRAGSRVAKQKSRAAGAESLSETRSAPTAPAAEIAPPAVPVPASSENTASAEPVEPVELPPDLDVLARALLRSVQVKRSPAEVVELLQRCGRAIIAEAIRQAEANAKPIVPALELPQIEIATTNVERLVIPKGKRRKDKP